MTRIKISLPESKPLFNTTLQVRVNDLNYGNHLSNDAVLRLCHEVRVQYFNRLGQSEKDFYGRQIIMADSACQYKAESYLFDKLQCALYLGRLHSHGIDFIYTLVHQEKMMEIARVKTGIVFFDYESRKIQRGPLNLEQLLLGEALDPIESPS
jgi:4-hydroxybenzoyl-CoA thioesterase